MKRLVLIGLLLVACVPRAPQGAFRNTSAPIWSAAAFAPDRAAGRWQQVAAFQSEGGACAAGALRITPAAGGLRIDGSLCLNGSATRVAGLARPAGSGRLAVPGQSDWWVLWVDEGYRTLAIGTPDGSFGFVLDRGPAAADRLAAAGEVFDFNGYNLAALRGL